MSDVTCAAVLLKTHSYVFQWLVREFPWRFLPYMLSELVHCKHLVLCARKITFVTIIQLCFMLHPFVHSKSIFLGACVIT